MPLRAPRGSGAHGRRQQGDAGVEAAGRLPARAPVPGRSEQVRGRGDEVRRVGDRAHGAVQRGQQAWIVHADPHLCRGRARPPAQSQAQAAEPGHPSARVQAAQRRVQGGGEAQADSGGLCE